ncbi:MAG: low molecular weight protein arginine phosphatase [Elusimicrobia bacterium]|nr:low molecular weight protein arginine phosphatase [Elusimicrobiota bacterium]
MRKKILFVCTGNACRSVMAEFLLGKLARERGLSLSVRSAGLAAEAYFQVPAGVRAALRGQGVLEVEHAPKLLTWELLAWAELVLVMERGQHDAILERFPEFRGKVQVLKSFAGRPGPEDVADPIGKPEAVFAACCQEIRDCLESLLGRAG